MCSDVCKWTFMLLKTCWRYLCFTVQFAATFGGLWENGENTNIESWDKHGSCSFRLQTDSTLGGSVTLTIFITVWSEQLRDRSTAQRFSFGRKHSPAACGFIQETWQDGVTRQNKKWFKKRGRSQAKEKCTQEDVLFWVNWSVELWVLVPLVECYTWIRSRALVHCCSRRETSCLLVWAVDTRRMYYTETVQMKRKEMRSKNLNAFIAYCTYGRMTKWSKIT